MQNRPSETRIPAPGPMPLSVIISCYNQAKTLGLLLASLERQTIPAADFEVIVADDGSQDETASLCRVEREFKLHFVTQKDEGYQKAKILNQALRHTQSEYLVFVDGDVILDKNFLRDHLSLRQTGAFVCGRRVDLGPRISQSLSLESVKNGKWDGLKWDVLLSGLQKDSVQIKRGLRIPYRWLRSLLGYNTPIDLLGSNFSAWRSDILEVNGFNEALRSYWGEDGDLYIRLRNSGKKAVNAKGLCVQFHVFHPRRTPSEDNIRRYQALLNDWNYRRAEVGYNESV